MNKAILISLAAVVVTIVIIAWAALRFLRADDADPFDEIPDEPRRPSRAPEDARLREAAPAAAAARRSPGRPAPADEMAWSGGRGERERLDPRPDRPRPDRDRGRDSGLRERGTQDRPAAPDRRPGSQGSPARPAPVPVAARAATSPRPADKGKEGPDWDTMSDVDYWAELAAEKPFSSGEHTIPPATSNGGGRRAAEPAKTRAAGRPDHGALPARSRQPRPAAAATGRSPEFSAAPGDSRPAHAPGRYANGSPEPATESLAALARLGNQAATQPPASPQRSAPQQAGPRGSQPRDLPRTSQQPSQPRDFPSRPQRAVPGPLDDDPLTSPSFPAINTSDSRSYRTGRSDTQPGGGRSAAAYNEPAQPFSQYPEPPRSNSGPNGYPVQSAPAGNPYGSFVTQPAASYQPPAGPVPQDPGYAAYTSQELPGGEGWYPQLNGHGNGHSNGNGHRSGHHRAPSHALPLSPATGGYLQGANGTNGHDQAGYRSGQHEAAHHQSAYPAAPYDQAGYVAQDAMYGRDAYQGYHGYGNGGR